MTFINFLISLSVLLSTLFIPSANITQHNTGQFISEPPSSFNQPTENEITGSALISKAVNVSTAAPGDILTYTIGDISYTGNDPLTDVTVTDQIPTGTAFIPGSATPTANSSEGQLIWNLGSTTLAIPGKAGSTSGSISVSGYPTGTTNGGQLITIPYTQVSSANRILIVNAFWKSMAGLEVEVLSVTFANQNLIQIGTSSYDSSRNVAMYYMINPPAIASNVLISFTGGVIGLGSVLSFSGVDQENPLGNYSGNAGNLINPTIVVSSEVGDLVLDAVVAEAFISSGTNQYPYYNVFQSPLRGRGSTKSAEFETTTMNWTLGQPISNTWAMGAVAIKPFKTPPTQITTLTADKSLVSTGDPITLDLTVTNTLLDTNISPGSLQIESTGGANCSSLTGPTIVSSDDDITSADDSVTYRWVCTASAGINLPSSLRFSVNATGTTTSSYPLAISNSVLVVPKLTYQVKVNSPNTYKNIQNIAWLDDAGEVFASTPSQTVNTEISSTNYHQLSIQAEGNGEVNLDLPGDYFLTGTEVQLTPTPSSGYIFGSWSGDGSQYLIDNGDGTWSVTIEKDLNLIATFYDTTAVDLLNFTAGFDQSTKTVNLAWQTAAEVNLLGFHLTRQDLQSAQSLALNQEIIPINFALMEGSNYSYADETILPGRTYVYYLHLVKMDSSVESCPSKEVFTGWSVYLPMLID